ncbi:MAG TPA: prolyl oligopeptidase family serine peptidase [Polyangiaceae bacterium]
MRTAFVVAPLFTTLIAAAAPDSCSGVNPGTGGAGGTAGVGGRSAGCGASAWPASGTYTIDVNGTPRQYIVKIPDPYSSQQAHRLIFAWHGLGGSAQQIANSRYYGLESRAAGTAIFVAGQGLATSQGGAGWPNTGGRDIAFVRALLDSLRASYCIDDARIFSTGMSYGGIMSNTVGCQLGNVFRAIAPIAGAGPYGGTACQGHVAAWLAHGNQDTIVPFSAGVASRDHWIAANHCTAQSVPVNPTGCVSYQGCDAGYPVNWCEFTGGHTVPSFASQAIWEFFAQF